MKHFVIFLILVGLFTSSAFAFEPSWTNYFSNPEFKIYKVQDNAYEFSIPYKISDAKLDRIVVDCDSTALLVYFDKVGTNSNLVINIPRDLLDAKIGEQDYQMFFILDQQEVEYQEIDADSNSRTFHIPLQTDGKILEIIATNVGMFSEPIPCGVGSDDESPYYQLLSPLKQSNSGIPFNEIQCNQNLVLLQKYDGSPACVTEQTKTKLIERGWSLLPNNTIKIKNTDLFLNYTMTSGLVKSAQLSDIAYAQFYYETMGVRLKEGHALPTEYSINLELNSPAHKGSISLQIPKRILDSLENQNDNWIIEIDNGTMSSQSHVKMEQNNSIDINYPAETNHIRIIGSVLE